MTTNEAQDDWGERLGAATYAYNSARHTSTGFAPYELMYGRLPSLPGDLLRPETRTSVWDLPTWHQEAEAAHASDSRTRNRGDSAGTGTPSTILRPRRASWAGAHDGFLV